MIQIPQPRKPSTPAGAKSEALTRAEEEVAEVRTKALERAMAEEAEELVAGSGAKLLSRRRRRVPYKGTTLDVLVPRLRMPDESTRVPDLFEALRANPHGVLELLEAGVSTRDVAGVIAGVSGEVRGTSSSTVSRRGIDVGNERLETLMSRRFDDEPIVAVVLDGTAIGRLRKKTTVMIAVGITADGRKVALSTGIAQYERADDIYPILRGVVERGVDPGVLWIADHGAGIRAALQRLTGPEGPKLQVCTTHAARNAVQGLPEAMEKEVRLRMYQAWAEPDADVALENLEALARELDGKGPEGKASASSIRTNMAYTVTVNRLGLEGDLRRQLRSTNLMESINDSVKGGLGNVKLWRNDEMRLRWVAHRLIELEEGTWTRIAEPRALVGLMERLTPARHDTEAILAKLPPSVAAARVPVPLEEDERLAELAARWCAAAPDAVWSGSPEILERLGLPAGGEVRPEELIRAMRCQQAETGTALRTPSRISVQRLDADGKPVKETVQGVIGLEWEVAAPPVAMREWTEADPAGRERIEAALTRAAAAAVERVTSTTQPHHGVAGAMALQRPAADDPGQILRVTGVAVAVVRGKGAKLGSPAVRAALELSTARAAEDAAKEVLDGALREAPPPERAAERPPAERPGPAPAPEPPSAALLAGVEARALEKAPRMVEAERDRLEAAAGRLEATRRGLEAVASEVRAWGGEHRHAAARQIAAAHHRAARDDPWHPLGRGARLVLGEQRTLWLLGEAARLRGHAEVSAEAAQELGELAPNPLAGLQEAVNRVELAAESVAAARELERRRLFEAVRQPRAESEPGAEELTLRDGRDRPVLSPIDRYGRALGARAEPLHRYAAALAPELVRMDEPSLRRLAAATGEPWRSFDPAAGMRQGRLERDRDAALTEHLEARRQVGRGAASAERAAEAREGSAFFEASERAEVAQGVAVAKSRELRQIGTLLAGERDRECGPELLVRRYPEAALHHAAHAALLQRQRGVEPGPRPARELEPVDAGVGLEA